MLRHAHIVVVALVAVSYYFLRSEPSLGRHDDAPNFTKGNGNGKVLFVTESSNGLSNVHLATCFALLENHPAINVHYASSPKLEPEVARISSTAIAKNVAAKPIIWHDLSGIDHAAAINREFNGFAGLIGPPGRSGLSTLMSYAAPGLVPYTADEYWDKYQQIVNLIEELDPAVVVLDNFFRPAMDAARNLNRSRAVISPNAMSDTFIGVQPRGGLFWKFPAFVSTAHLSIWIDSKTKSVSLYAIMQKLTHVVTVLLLACPTQFHGT
ncbi:hypothetical protein NQ176_g3174 [Zarea fungicola]|uniref:Uncharacterized protein n=1 Tax=Zarea fungicola TaxID=93591 RepID=A0ACC1NKF0_9HYPO|nr:hypothetical protein NQ176_g3174 [Lecanicillium fungicola]